MTLPGRARNCSAAHSCQRFAPEPVGRYPATVPPRAMILAAGLGSRLGHLSTHKPKPMLPICGSSLVRWSVLWLRAQGVREIVINLHHLGEQIEADLRDGSELGVDIAYSRESDELLGTGGGLRQARPLLDDGKNTPIVVVNGKILTDLDLPTALAEHRRRQAAATLVLRHLAPGETFGRLRCDHDGLIRELLGVCQPGAEQLQPQMYTGVMLLQPSVLDLVPQTGPACIVRTACRQLFETGGRLFGHVSRAYWWEHSTVERYLAGVFHVLSGRAALVHRPGPLTGIDPSAEVHPSAHVEGPVWIGPGVKIGADARIGPLVQLGTGSNIAPGVHIRRSVVWSHVHVASDLEGAVATA